MPYRLDLFTATVCQLRSGRAQEELSEKLNKVVNACRDTGKVGELTLKIKVKPDKGDTEQYFIEDSITEKLPEFEKGKTIMFGTPEGNLQRTDPRQGDLDLRTVGENPQPAKSVSEQPEETREV